MSFENGHFPSRRDVKRRQAQRASILGGEQEVESSYEPDYDTPRRRRSGVMDRVANMSEGSFKLAMYGLLLVGTVGLDGGCAAVTESTYGSDDAKEYLEEVGFTNVVPLDTDYFFIQLTGCGGGDNIKYEFSAVGPTGIPIDEVDVCKGLFKGATFRQGN